MMSSAYRFNLNDPNLTISEILSRFPSTFKEQFAVGIGLTGKLSEEQTSQLLDIVSDSIASTTQVSEKDIASKFAMQPKDAAALLLAANILVVALVTSKISATEMLQQLRDTSLIDEEQGSGDPLGFLQSVERVEDSVTRAIRRSSLAAESLPVLTELEMSVDIRPAFDKETNRIAFAVPVVIMHLDTDKYGAEIWLQLNKRQLEKMVENLKTALQQMDEAERWSNQALKP